MTTTVGDMTTFMQCILNGGAPLLQDPNISAMSTKPHTHGDTATVRLTQEVMHSEIWDGKQPSCWGLGWRVNHDSSELKFGEHTTGTI
eukprot:SAG31_NODE_7618_length_1639_cov_0.986364_1_plen_87_part_10